MKRYAWVSLSLLVLLNTLGLSSPFPETSATSELLGIWIGLYFEQFIIQNSFRPFLTVLLSEIAALCLAVA